MDVGTDGGLDEWRDGWVVVGWVFVKPGRRIAMGCTIQKGKLH